MAPAQGHGGSREWVNWAGDQSCRPARIVRPPDLLDPGRTFTNAYAERVLGV